MPFKAIRDWIRWPSCKNYKPSFFLFQKKQTIVELGTRRETWKADIAKWGKKKASDLNLLVTRVNKSLLMWYKIFNQWKVRVKNNFKSKRVFKFQWPRNRIGRGPQMTRGLFSSKTFRGEIFNDRPKFLWSTSKG